ncbi:leucyl aminopeptidase [Xenophilus arseniciresistens]|uniref:Probable cytosol aminopeptidase n=1 Tax=Xenophilus arseniciresistens TaxID=1283306 RepID=A0AAE3N8J1_9BURK|nr:leucyl aminopeptidase [Xenophilus arseniciresistens]MDA7417595.1 leucyl aminopeptidase [Xenophilus arseniciresistens]
MDFQLKTLSLAQAAAEKTDALVVLVPRAEPLEGSDALSRILHSARAAKDLGERAGKLLALYRPAGVAAPRVWAVHAGEGSPADIRAATLAGTQAALAAQPRRVALVLAGAADAAALHAAVVASADASYVYTTTRSKAEPRGIRQLTLGVADAKALQPALATAVATVRGVEFAKEWANRPGNHCTPTMLADAAQSLAKAPRVRCEVLGPKEVAALKMGSFMAVAQGSAEPLRFIVLRYQGAAKDVAPQVLVGKGITFDTGGVSLKPAAEMDEMKFDMGGAASVLGVFRALGELQPAVNVIGLIPACENMNDGRALKPGDVVTSMNGQTIEVLNTDAEGRLILCDALEYAKRFKPAAVVDIATLTGACVIALGGVRSGLFSGDDSLAQALQAAGEQAQDRCWRMPLDDEYGEGLKTHFADVANVAGRAGGAITAAKFLQRFTADLRWAHLDIAGTAWKSGAAKGATGRPVGLLLQYLLSQQDAAAARPKKARSAQARSAATAAPEGKGGRAGRRA